MSLSKSDSVFTSVSVCHTIYSDIHFSFCPSHHLHWYPLQFLSITPITLISTSVCHTIYTDFHFNFCVHHTNYTDIHFSFCLSHHSYWIRIADSFSFSCPQLRQTSKCDFVMQLCKIWMESDACFIFNSWEVMRTNRIWIWWHLIRDWNWNWSTLRLTQNGCHLSRQHFENYLFQTQLHFPWANELSKCIPFLHKIMTQQH